MDKVREAREMDALILKEVFKADVVWKDYELDGTAFSPAGFYGTFPNNPMWAYHPGGFGSDAREFKTVLTAMSDLGFYIEIFFDSATWTVTFIRIDGHQDRHVGNNVELELAGCLAALKAVQTYTRGE